MAIAHDDDLRMVENMVRPRQMFGLGATSKRAPRKPSLRTQLSSFCMKTKFLYSLKMAVYALCHFM